jgi:acetyl-CoA carboxylase biotin carboxyl carrier protein
MGSGSANPEDVFNVRRVRQLVELMQEFELAEVDLRQADQRIRLRKDQEPVAGPVGYFPPPPPPPPPPHGAPGHAAPSHAAPPPPSAAAPVAEGKFIVSPMVGTFYSAAKPDSPPFVKPGDQVGPDTVVCIIEAMKVFNEIPAECSGKIAATLVENGAAVEYGQKLFRIE